MIKDIPRKQIQNMETKHPKQTQQYTQTQNQYDCKDTHMLNGHKHKHT